jgi:hypothetical protein
MPAAASWESEARGTEGGALKRWLLVNGYWLLVIGY